MDWSVHYPAYIDPDPTNVNAAGARRLKKNVEVADIGCGFGGLLVALAPVMPDTLMVGMWAATGSNTRGIVSVTDGKSKEWKSVLKSSNT